MKPSTDSIAPPPQNEGPFLCCEVTWNKKISENINMDTQVIASVPFLECKELRKRKMIFNVTNPIFPVMISISGWFDSFALAEITKVRWKRQSGGWYKV